MENKKIIILAMVVFLGLLFMVLQMPDRKPDIEQKESLLVLWTTDNKETVENMLFMYSHNAMKQNWFDEVVVLVWGPSQKLLLNDEALQGYVRNMQESGVRFIACKACADNYDIADPLSELGVEVFYTGQFMTDWLKSGKRMLTL